MMRDVIKKSLKENQNSILWLICLWFTLFVLDYYLSAHTNLWVLSFIRYIWDFHNSYLQGIITNIIWALLVILLIDIWVKERDDKKDKQRILKQIKSFDQIFSNLLSKNRHYMVMMIDKLDEEVWPWFPFNSLINIFKAPSLLITDSYEKKAYEYYFETISEMWAMIKQLLFNIDLVTYVEHEELLKLLLSFINEIGNYNLKETIYADKHHFSKHGINDPLDNIWKLIKESFESTQDEPKNEWLSSANIMTKYCLLFFQMNFILSFTLEYGKIKNRIGI